MKILTEAGGSLVSNFMIESIQKSGNFSVSSDIQKNCAAANIADDFLIFPRVSDKELWNEIENILINKKIDIVIPSFDEMLMGWSKRKEYFAMKGIQVLISPQHVINIFQDKWKTYEFFSKYSIPAPLTSLSPEFPFLKPRFGRGSEGIFVEKDVSERVKKFQKDYVSQEIISGIEYTVDCLFDHLNKPVYIIPRKRQNVSKGKSLSGIVCMNEKIINEVKKLANATSFIGPINIQLFLENNVEQTVKFIEVNPRIAGGMALGFSASENWVPLFIDILKNKKIKPKAIRNNLQMFRYYKEIFVE